MKNPPSRKPKQLSKSLSSRLDAYAATAGAVGIGMLTFTPSAEARIVYTPAHKVLDCCSVFPLDLNHDGITDFQLQFETSDTHAIGFAVFPAQSGNQVRGVSIYASAIPAKVPIESDWRFQPSHGLMASFHAESTSGSRGKWVNVKNRYLGLKFFIKGQIHYGWARLSVAVDRFDVTATLTGYAYETVANKGLMTGKTKGPVALSPGSATGRKDRVAGSLGSLASGYAGMVSRPPSLRDSVK